MTPWTPGRGYGVIAARRLGAGRIVLAGRHEARTMAGRRVLEALLRP
ncbi:hypothetical protein ACWER6_28415 [Streptomyces sp. NPDC004009]